MRKEIQQLWIEALRSGKYVQGKDALRVNDTYCCLGVLCDIYAQQTGGLGGKWVERVIYDNRKSFVFRSLEDNATVLSFDVAQWAGLKSQKGSYHQGKRCLSEDNDQGASFDQIANTIEELYEQL